MAWFNDNSVVVNDDDDDDDDEEDQRAVQLEAANPQDINSVLETKTDDETRSLVTCPSCGHNIPFQDQHQAAFQDLPGLPAGVKFDPSDQEILEHLEAKVALDKGKLHPLIDEFITTIEGENGICYTHPQKLPGVSNDGQIRHFFHRPSKAYTTGTRKRRKVLTDEDGSETRWHKTGKTRAVVACGTVKGFKKILVLYTNYGRQKKPEKTNWVMHQYHLGGNEDEKDGELVVSKVFYQTQPRHCGSSIKDSFEPKLKNRREQGHAISKRQSTALVDHFCGPSFISYDHHHGSHSSREGPSNQLIPNLVAHAHRHDASSLIHLSADTSKGKPQRN